MKLMMMIILLSLAETRWDYSINGKGYLATGGQTTGQDVWEYDPATDLWKEKSNLKEHQEVMLSVLQLDREDM